MNSTLSNHVEKFAILPYLDIYAGALFYICLLSMEFAKTTQEVDLWLDSIFIPFSHSQVSGFLKSFRYLTGRLEIGLIGSSTIAGFLKLVEHMNS